MGKRPYKYQKRVANRFTVHPKVVQARKRVIRTFMAQPFDPAVWAVANKRLAYLLAKYHPVVSLPFEQLNVDQQCKRLYEFLQAAE